MCDLFGEGPWQLEHAVVIIPLVSPSFYFGDRRLCGHLTILCRQRIVALLPSLFVPLQDRSTLPSLSFHCNRSDCERLEGGSLKCLSATA